MCLLMPLQILLNMSVCCAFRSLSKSYPRASHKVKMFAAVARANREPNTTDKRAARQCQPPPYCIQRKGLLAQVGIPSCWLCCDVLVLLTLPTYITHLGYDDDVSAAGREQAKKSSRLINDHTSLGFEGRYHVPLRVACCL